jgi:alkylated DNA repair protein (DNA oxidative demethylase)
MINFSHWKRAGLHLLSGFATTEEIAALVEGCRVIVEQAPLVTPVMPSGDKFRCSVSGAGRAAFFSTPEKGYHYTATHPTTREPWPELPPAILAIAERALAFENVLPPASGFDSMLLNRYRADVERRESLGLHVDSTEQDHDAPIVLVSIGADCEFIVGGAQRSDDTNTIVLSNGDVLIMSGAARHWFHGVKRVMASMTSPIRHGVRLSCSLRSVYL